MVMSRDQHAKQNHNIKIRNKSFGTVKHFNYLGKPETTQKSIHAENRGQVEVREFLLSFGAESFACPFAIQKCKD